MKRGRRTQQRWEAKAFISLLWQNKSRCENERMLMAMYGIDSEGGEDIPQQGKSYFLDLLQQGTLEKIILIKEHSLLRQWGVAWAVHQRWGAEVLQQGEEEQEEESGGGGERRVWTRGGFPQNRIQPASGFLTEKSHRRNSHSYYLPQALKHQLPLGMLQGIEERLHDTFSTNPNTEYVVEDLSRW